MNVSRTSTRSAASRVMADPGRRGARQLAALLAAVSLLLVVVHVVVHNVPGAPQLAEHTNPVRLFLDVSGEHNLWAWFNSVLLATAGVWHGAAGLLARSCAEPAWRWWLVTSGLLLALSLDDVTALHERLQGLGVRLGGGSGFTYAAWLVPGVFVGAGVAVAFWRLSRHLAPQPRVLLVGGLATFLGAALGIEAVGNALLDWRGPSPLYGGFVLVEELLEALAVIALLVCPLFAVHLQRDDTSVRLRYGPVERRSAPTV